MTRAGGLFGHLAAHDYARRDLGDVGDSPIESTLTPGWSIDADHDAMRGKAARALVSPPEPARRPRSTSGDRGQSTTRWTTTGQWARVAQYSLTDPMSIPTNSPWPRLPTTKSLAPLEASMRAGAG